MNVPVTMVFLHQTLQVLVCVVSCAGCGQIPTSGARTPVSGGSIAQDANPGTLNQPEPSDFSADSELSILTNPESTEPQAVSAAGALLDHPDHDWSKLLAALDDAQVRSRVIKAALENTDRSVRLLLRTTPETLEPGSRLKLIEPLAYFRSREVIAALIRELGIDSSRDISFDALCLLTGRADLGMNQHTWQAWAASANDLSDQQWRENLLNQIIVRVTDLESRLQLAQRALSDAYRRLYLITPAPDRAALLAELLESDDSGLRALGFELSDRELAANAKLDPVVAQAAIALLEDRDAQVRASAARLVNRLAPPEAAEVVSRALVAETQAVAAEPLLQAASRWPSAMLVEPVLRWLSDPATLDAACQAGVALYDAGLLVSDDARERIRALLTPIPDDARAARLILLAKVGTEADRKAIAGLLESTTDRVRMAAADALARTEAGVPALLDAAAKHPQIAPDALVVLARHNRLNDSADQITSMDAWTQAFEQASALPVRAELAKQILARFGQSLTPEQKAAYEAAAGPGG
jgi:HEAT repeat protein